MLIKYDNSEIHVQPEGFQQTLHFRSFLCTANQSSSTIQIKREAQPRLWPLIDAIGPIRYRFMCSLNVFWETLNRLHEAQSFEFSTGEQFALNLLSLGIHYSYVTNERVGIIYTLGQQANPLRYKLSYFYDQFDRFQHEDGSVSNYGTRDMNGSVWLSALMLRGLALAGRTRNYLDHYKISELVDFLATSQRKYTGCFRETGLTMPYLLHGTHSFLNRALHKTVLAAYVLVALSENPMPLSFPHHSDLQTSANQIATGAINCLLPVHTNRHVKNLEEMSNYALALVTYATHFIPNIWDRINNRTMPMLHNRLRTIHSPHGNMLYLPENGDTESTETIVSPVTMEATAYYYLVLSSTSDAMEKKVELIRFLVFHHDFHPTTWLTHATVQVLMALADFSSKHLDIHGLSTLALGCQAQINPARHRQEMWLAEPDKHLAKWSSAEEMTAEQMHEIVFNIKNLVDRQCVLAQTEFTYTVPYEHAFEESWAKFRVHARHWGRAHCISPTVEICMGINPPGDRFYPSLPMDVGTVVIEIWPPASYSIPERNSSFWRTYNQSAEDRQKPRHIDFGPNGEVLFLFDGWSEEEAREKMYLMDLRRCVQVQFNQVYYAEHAQPLVFKGYDLHRLYPVSRGIYRFPDCRSSHNLDERAVQTEEFESTINAPCPVCISSLQDTLFAGKQFEDFVGTKQADAVLFRPIVDLFKFESTVMLFTTRMKNQSSYWFTQVRLPNSRCHCNIPYGTRYALTFSDVQFDYSSRDNAFDFKLSEHTNNVYLLFIRNPYDLIDSLRKVVNQCFVCQTLMRLLRRID
ncbi:unnamed protein product [Echinostoma caproni]|uniref:TED_complement domain-containing protein n=1 Tax=Echinostoma caproni TaxID=27848 RepID=A0A183AJM7_9TREM|nr:unnamed protein product [Echinostoma caproni]